MASTSFGNGTENPCMPSDVGNSSEGEPCTTDIPMSLDVLKWLYVVVVIALTGVLLISILFLTAVFVCKRVKRKGSLRYIYETKPKRKINASVYSIRSQGILELNYTNTGSGEYVNVLEELCLDQQASQQDLACTSSIHDDLPQTKTASVDFGNVENHIIVEVNEELGNFNHKNIVKQSTKSESNNMHFSSRSTSRSSIKSESGNGHRIQHNKNGEQEDASGIFSRQQSMQVSTPSEAGLQVNGPNTVKSKTIEGCEKSVEIHQEYIHSQQEENKIFVTGLQVNTTSQFGDIPAFIDPEWISDGNQDIMVKLGIPLLPDIYSSQILSTVASSQGVTENVDTHDHSDSGLSESPVCIIAEPNKSTKPLDKIVSIQPHTYDDLTSAEHYPPHGSIMAIRCYSHSPVEDSEALYDQPTLKSSIENNQLLPEPLFDDPGYDRVFKGLAANASPPKKDNQVPLFDDPCYGQGFKGLAGTVAQNMSEGHCSPHIDHTVETAHTPFSAVSIVIEMHEEEEEEML